MTEFRFILLVFTITGSVARYSIGQIRASLKFDCSTAFDNPAANVVWTVKLGRLG